VGTTARRDLRRDRAGTMAASRRRVLLLKGTVQAGGGRSLDDEDGTAYCNVLAATGLVVEVLAPLTVAYIHEDALSVRQPFPARPCRLAVA